MIFLHSKTMATSDNSGFDNKTWTDPFKNEELDDVILDEEDEIATIDEVVNKSLERVNIGTALSSFQKSSDRFRPLSPKEQNQYAARYKELLLIKDSLPTLKGKKLSEAQKLVVESDRIMEHLCASCWRLAWMIVREQTEKRFGKERATHMLPDIMAEANSALVLSVRQYDPARIPMFHTYAAQVVRDHVRAVLSKDSYMQLAPSWNRLKRIAVARLPELVSELGRNPTKEELQNDLLARCLVWADEHLTEEQKKLPESQKQTLRIAKLRKQGMIGALRDIDEVLRATQQVASLDTPIGEDGGSTLGDMISSTGADEVYQRVEQEELRSIIGKALSMLADRERDVLILRYGLNGEEVMKYNDIAEMFDVSAERIRQIERTALSKLATPHGQFAGLSDFLPGNL